ncbi:MAG TPA: M23 family metallopeptidase [Patescibacteria group bacterium]|jgi:hypothetical protein|nr:M23 family metallopeptidase [Patescibacteria group bacterium]
MQKKMMQALFQVLVLVGVLSVGVFSTWATLEPTGLAKPLSGLRDYNGTYDGSITTGSIGFVGGTLYRDNQDGGATSGCLGEGCGKHPGVDIPVPSGTSVFAVSWGQVVISRCDDSWGGLIVLRSQNPWNPAENVYYIYGHLSAREYTNSSPVNAGDWVSTGVFIGRTGGGAKNPCHGNSTGAHLHFQVDRDDGNPEPYYPAAGQLNQKDDSYQVSGRTYNPIPFLTGGYRWTFGQNGNRELWDLFSIQSWGVSNGALWVDAGNDPYIRRGGLTNCGRLGKCTSSSIAAEAANFRQVYLDLYNGCSTGVGKVYFTTSTSTNWSEDKSVPYFTTYGAQNLHVWMPSNSKWNGIITGLRIDPAESCSPYAYDPTYYGEITIEH